MSDAAPIVLNALEASAVADSHRLFPLRYLPAAVRPYGELMRLHKPAGIAMCYFPCLYGTFLIGALGQPVPILSMISINVRLLFLSFLIRSMLCTWNDVCDVNIDRQVARTRIRPVARGSVSVFAGAVFTLVQTVLLLAAYYILLPTTCLAYSAPFLALHYSYPFMKRWTHHPQLILGLALPLGVFVAFPALGQTLDFKGLLGRVVQPSSSLGGSISTALATVSPFNTREQNISDKQESLFDSVGAQQTSRNIVVDATIQDTTAVNNLIGALCISAAIIFWTLLNDTVYAAQDAEDDAKAGVGSPVVFWGENVRNFLRVLAASQLAALVAVSFLMMSSGTATAGIVYSTLTCGGTLLGAFSMVEFVDLKSPKSCGWWFNKGNVMLGCAMAAGLMGEYAAGLLL